MAKVLDVYIEVLTIDVGCDACAWTVRDIPRELAELWLEGHRQPAVLSVVMRVNGCLTRWNRRSAA